MTVLRILLIGSCSFMKHFRLFFNILPWQDIANRCFCPQLFQLPVLVSSDEFDEFKISFCLAMFNVLRWSSLDTPRAILAQRSPCACRLGIDSAEPGPSLHIVEAWHLFLEYCLQH